MSKTLCFACHFADGSAVRMRADLRELRKLPKGGLLVPDFEYHHGKLPTDPNELQEWAVQALDDLARRTGREFAAQTPVGIMWRFAPGKKPQKMDITPEFAIFRALLTRGGAWQSLTFANGSRGFWKISLSNVPWRIEITISGPLPRDKEIGAWLLPLLTIPGAKEAFQQWPHQRTDPVDPSIEIEFAHKP